MASGETNFASLPSKTSPSNADMFLLEDTEDTKKINYGALADAILNKLTSKTYSGLDTSAKNLVSALNELNSKTQSFNIEYEENNTIPRPVRTKNLLLIGGRSNVGFCIFIPQNTTEYYQISNSGILKTIIVTGENISLELGDGGYGSSLFCTYLIL